MRFLKKMKNVTAVVASAAVITACAPSKEPKDSDFPSVLEVIEVYSTINDLISEGEDYFENKFLADSIKLNGYEFKFSKAQIVREKDFNSKEIIVLIKDIHNSPSMQEEIFVTLEELLQKNNLKLVGLEGWCEGEATKDRLRKWFEDKTVENGSLKEKVDKFLSDCEELNKLCKLTNSKDKEKLVEKLSYQLLGGYLFEMAYDEKIKSCGLEDKELYSTSRETYSKVYEERKKRYLKDFEQKLIIERSRLAVENLLSMMKKENTNLGVMIFGAGHTKSVTEYLKEKSVSYIVVEPYSYTPRSDQFNVEKWFKGRR